jgi:hypothetical protein
VRRQAAPEESATEESVEHGGDRRVNLKSIFLGLAASLLLVACGSDQSGSEVRLVRADVGRIESPDATEEQVAQLVRGNNAFAFEMYRTGSGDGNLSFPPTASRWPSRWRTPARRARPRGRWPRP